MVGARAVLVSEKRLVRDGLKEMLQKSMISVIGEAPDMRELLATMEMQADPELVIGHTTSDQSHEVALELVHGLRRQFPRAKLVVLTDACTKPLLSSFLCADVNAILLTSISSEILLRSLELVLFDHRLFPAEIISLMMDHAQARPPLDAVPSRRVTLAGTGSVPTHIHRDRVPPLAAVVSDPRSTCTLSKREHQIIDCLVCGSPNKAIARELNITEATVKVYVKGLLRKLKVSNRTQVAIWALQQSHPVGADRSAAAVGAPGTPLELHGQTALPTSIAA